MMLKKVLSVWLAFVLTFGVLSVTGFAKTSVEADTHLQYGTDGKFRIMQISDMQDGFPMKPITKKLLRRALTAAPVDLIVLTGDNITARSDTKWIAERSIHEFMSIFEEFGIPVAMTFGNHDDQETPATKAFQLSVYEKYDCFIGCAGEALGDTNLCSYYVPIYSSKDKNDMISNLWLIDSGTYNTENELGGYACTTKAQIEWYKKASQDLQTRYGRKIPSLMFQHIIVPEIWDALERADDQTAVAGYKLPESAKGELNECPCPPAYSNGQFDAVLERADVLAMFFGHDHTNSFEIPYKGVDLVNTPGAGFKSYNGWNVGVRVITLNENDPWQYETQVISYFDLFDFDNDCARYLFKLYSSTSDTPTQIACFFKYIFACVLSVLNFRTVK